MYGKEKGMYGREEAKGKSDCNKEVRNHCLPRDLLEKKIILHIKVDRKNTASMRQQNESSFTG